MASLAKRPNGKWRARYRDSKGKEHSRHFDRKVDAQQWLDVVTASKVRGDYVDPKDSRITFEDYAKRWRATITGAPQTLRIYDNALDKHIYPALGAMAIGSIRKSDVQGLISGLVTKNYAPPTVRGIARVIKMVMQSAVDDRVIPSSPALKIKVPSGVNKKLTIPTKEQVGKLLAAMPDYMQPLFLTLIGTGIRIGEALALRVGDVNLTNRTIHIERTKDQRGVIKKTKTETSVRDVPIGRIVTAAVTPLVVNRRPTEPLFINKLSEPITYPGWRYSWLQALKKTGLDLDTHDLRHYCASALISGGASVKQVQQMLGHANATVTLSTYSHLFHGDEDRTRTVLDAALDGLPAALSATLPASDPEPDPLDPPEPA